MQPHRLVSAAAAPTVQVLRGITHDRLVASTPCAEYDVRTLLGHLLHWGPSLAGAARKQLVPPPEGDVQPAGADWLPALEKQTDDLVAAWGDESAWAGATRMGYPTELPAEMIGGMVLGELVVHGWDLARATGKEPRWDADVLTFVHGLVAETAEQGREMGAYGAAVPVPESAPVLHRILGMTGRDPGWPSAS